ncbi:hypothetical protein [Nocardioides limicola]|uniref:hypothetical protein n=1 Tax=Nocardioides limicola TaxID=2803368 RepID=UPI00193B52A2|nr:hypothetical protein [Nocardioides sp. DJM-14]
MDEHATLRPFAVVAWGLILVIADLRFGNPGIDLIPDPVGWLMASLACTSLAGKVSHRSGALRLAALVAGVAAVVALPDWLGHSYPPIEIIEPVLMVVFTFAVCTAIMALAPQKRATANVIRWADLAVTGVITVAAVTVTSYEPAETPLLTAIVLTAAIAGFVLVIWFVVLLFSTSRLVASPAAG